MEEGCGVSDDQNQYSEVMDLPPGFRFHPTDEEIITNYLTEKVVNARFSSSAIGDADLNKCEPWDLPKRAKMGEKEWYFFCQRDRKYPTGMRTNRATECGYWKATGKDREIRRGKSLVGMKKTLVFYTGRAPKGEKSNWVMHEFRLEGSFSYYNLPNKSSKDEWVVCRVMHKNEKKTVPEMQGLVVRTNPSQANDMSYNYSLSASLPPLTDYSSYGNDISYEDSKPYVSYEDSKPSSVAVSSATCTSHDNYYPNDNVFRYQYQNPVHQNDIFRGHQRAEHLSFVSDSDSKEQMAALASGRHDVDFESFVWDDFPVVNSTPPC